MKRKTWKVIKLVRKKSPLVHNITNYVVMNNTANALLAIGASPVMAHAEEEVEDMVNIASSLVINIGTLSESWVKAMKLALKQANTFNKPVILDPVGSGATPYRNKIISELLDTGTFTVIRGNASEIMAMVSEEYITKGVDSTHSAEKAMNAAKFLYDKYGSIVCISGAIDHIISGQPVIKIKNGHQSMTKVTGMGCIATALIGAFIGAEKNTLLAVTSAMALMGVAGELASIHSNGPGSLQVNFFDKLYNISEEEYYNIVKIE